jgi:Ca2+-binding RTX toxin-like protein
LSHDHADSHNDDQLPRRPQQPPRRRTEHHQRGVRHQRQPAGGDVRRHAVRAREHVGVRENGDEVRLTGISGSQTITGSTVDDNIDGGAGSDSLSGGSGNDWFEYTDGADIASDIIDGGAGSEDALRLVPTSNQLFNFRTATISNVEAISDGSNSASIIELNNTQVGAGKITRIAGLGGGDALRIFGGSVNLSAMTVTDFDTVSLFGSSLADTITGTSLNDVIFGDAGADVLNGGAGDDLINGQSGQDTMTGGDGNDVYYVDNSRDEINETNANVATGGLDTVYASTGYTLSDNVEQLLLTPGATLGNGNGGDNSLYGTLLFAGCTLDGKAGNDVLYGSNYADSLIGGADNDILIAYLSVGGVDTLVGGTGSDVYYLFETGDVLTELAGEGFDTVYSQANVTLAANIEQLIVYGAATVATGNGSDNNIFGNNSSLALFFDGADGNDWLIGGTANDTLIGGQGSDILQGLGGNNSMVGEEGDDQYYSTSANDVIVEAIGGGFDTLYANYNIAGGLYDNIEQLVLFGGAAIGVGNQLDNTIYGNNSPNGLTLSGGVGNDLIFGSAFGDTFLIFEGTGNDTIVGGGGADIFQLTNGSFSGGQTRIVDFADGVDRIELTGQGYGVFSIGSTILVSGGPNALISFFGGTLSGSSLILAGVNQSSITAADFIF